MMMMMMAMMMMMMMMMMTIVLKYYCVDWWLQAVKTTHSMSITRDCQSTCLLSNLTLCAPSWYHLILIKISTISYLLLILTTFVAVFHHHLLD